MKYRLAVAREKKIVWRTEGELGGCLFTRLARYQLSQYMSLISDSDPVRPAKAGSVSWQLGVRARDPAAFVLVFLCDRVPAG
jgi:hypothetical protein